MYKIRLWTTALLVALCTGFYSCSGDEEDEKILNDIIHVDNIFGNAFLRDLVEKYSDDVNCIYGGESSTGVWVSGIKNKHLWFICFDKKTEKQIFEWEDTEITDEVTKVYEGYGKYTDVRIERILPTYYKKTSSGYILLFRFRYNDDDISSSNVKINQIELHRVVFVSNNSSKSVSLTWEQSNNLVIKDWYKESIALLKSCYSHKGDLIYTTTIENGIAGIPISYEEGIYVSNSYIERCNYKEGQIMWHTYVTPPFEVPSDARSAIALLDNSTNIWKYRVDYTFYDGTKKEYTFSINIDNGEIQ